MTQTEEVSMTFESKTPMKQMNGHSMAGNGRRDPEESSPTSTSPSGRVETSAESVLAMGSTDSAENTHGGGPSCGLVSSLFPSSCRGRAEAFARRLHRRLTSLGGENGSQDDFDLSKPNETSWLHPSAIRNGTGASNSSNIGNHVLEQQPRHSPESDLFYDLDGELEENGIGSPAEEVTAAELAHLLVNHQSLKVNHHDVCPCSSDGARPSGNNLDCGSDGVYSSPITGNTPENEESDVYFDPLSSDGEKKKDVFFDPVTTTESEGSATISNGCGGPKMVRVLRRKLEMKKDQEESSESSETQSSCSLQKDEPEIRRLQADTVESADESSNGKSSVDTTTSFDSLWSTLSDSTLSESSVKNDVTLSSSQMRVPKSHSDSEIPVKGRLDIDFQLERRIEMANEGVDEVDFTNGTLENGDNTKNLLNGELKICLENGVNRSVKENHDDDKLNGDPELNAVKEPSETDSDHSTYNSLIRIPGALEYVLGDKIQDSTPASKIEVESSFNEKSYLNNSTDGKDFLRRLDTTDLERQDEKCREVLDLLDEDKAEEEEEQRPPRVRRCSSLKTGKTPPGTPGRKKIVRFADVLGLDLADVRTFLDEIPKIPNSAYSDLIYDDVVFHKESSPINCGVQSWSARYLDNSRTTSVLQKPDRVMVPLFQQPGGLPGFMDFVRDRLVCLENVLVTDPVTLCLKGSVRVCNIDFHKSVHIRYTLNSWKTFSDLQATYAPNSCDGFSDKFTFNLYCHTLRVGQRLEFAVRFQCKGTQYWDNNLGANYCFQCLPASPPAGYIPITAPESTHDWSPMFY